ncbi:uncharacterized protein LOC131877755 isoform X2 [Tigriopus californicus]|uniref:uncharacterized protein LOC131877755 isoform X2 n=1 Tax=Tigriopus californicus TaxID=6832 RepID=UPI0027D9D30F|nr:uncharacterized protein LOC131877755 isoform X2 [Tigriopus californicus]
MSKTISGFNAIAIILLILYYVTLSRGRRNKTLTDNSRESKVFSFFQLVQFVNGPCNTTAGRQGACFTPDECLSRGGMGAGTCAAGFGVCCTFSLACGATSTEECSFLMMNGMAPGMSPIPSPCVYTICRSAPDICRIRFDFLMFTLAGPAVGTTVRRNGPDILDGTMGGTIGDCLMDSMTITSPGGVSSPTICGSNTGQHMVMDASDACNQVIFTTRGMETRNWDIKVTQFACANDMGGPPGCLQYFNGMMGTVSSFNFPSGGAVVPGGMAVPASATHLSNQCYSICFRQEPGQCAICFAPVVAGGESKMAENMVQGSFGLSNPVKSRPRAEDNKDCLSDYLRIPGAQPKNDVNAFVVGSVGEGVPTFSKICGRYFAVSNNGNKRFENNQSICTQRTPFRIDFKTDADEMVTGTMTNMAMNNEQAGFPGGIVGFNLNWALVSC